MRFVQGHAPPQQAAFILLRAIKTRPLPPPRRLSSLSSSSSPPLWAWEELEGPQKSRRRSANKRAFSLTAARRRDHHGGGGGDDPRIRDLGREIADDYAQIRQSYSTPKYPIVLAHGLLGFATLRPAGLLLAPIHYWHGIHTALEAQGATVITPAVPASATISARAAKLAADIDAAVGPDTPVNVVAHSMGGLDARLMASPAFLDTLSRSSPLDQARRPKQPRVASVVTVSTPHHGSAYASHVIAALGPTRMETARRALAAATGWADTGAFAQLTPAHMRDVFNPATPDDPDVRYFSYGAMTKGRPPLLSPFRASHAVVEAAEGPNDGLVSVASSRWGEYKGTLVGVSHLDLINWHNRIGWAVRKCMGEEKTFNAIAFYLDIADMLAKEGL